MLPVVSAFFSSLCSGFGPLLTVDDTPTGRARRGSCGGGDDCSRCANRRSTPGHGANWQTGARSGTRHVVGNEAFHEAVLHWLARGNVVPLDLAALLPFQDGVRSQFRSVVADHHAGIAAQPGDVAQFTQQCRPGYI